MKREERREKREERERERERVCAEGMKKTSTNTSRVSAERKEKREHC
jgi:hypothetical protein